VKPAPSDSWNVRCRPLKRPKPRGRHSPSGSEIRNLASGFQISSFLDFVFYKGRGLLAHWTTCQGPQSQVKHVRGRGKGCGLMDPLDHTPSQGRIVCLWHAAKTFRFVHGRVHKPKNIIFLVAVCWPLDHTPPKKQRDFAILLAIRPHPPFFYFWCARARAKNLNWAHRRVHKTFPRKHAPTEMMLLEGVWSNGSIRPHPFRSLAAACALAPLACGLMDQ